MKTVSLSSQLKRISDPEELLKKALQERCQKNPMYSLRSFAKATGISHTVLSLVLSGKRRLSKKATLKLADYLELDPKQRQKLLTGTKAPEPEDYQTISMDTFEVISDWYHYAILSLLDLEDAQFDARWIAKQLNIQNINAKLAMERLQRLGLVSQDDRGRWRQTGQPIKIDNRISTTATKKFHKQLLARAAESIDNDPIAHRDFSSMTFTLDPSQVEYARKRIQEFRRQLVAELELKGKPSSVYNLTIQMYPVTPITDQEK
ncbi:MAG TPA: TIGR02147 family protein [Bdellovibrio sp.]|nr:TIGR02147 family protein [Bdellovibrio sp.]